MSNNERVSVYNSTSDMVVTPIERTITKISKSPIVADYIGKHNVSGGIIYTCSKISVFGTNYREGQVVILPNSDNKLMEFGEIVELLGAFSVTGFDNNGA